MRRLAFVLFVLGLLAGPALAQADASAHVDLLDPAAIKTYGNEAADFGVKPRQTLQEAAKVDSDTPTSIPGGKVITTGELAKALANPNIAVLVVDVLESNSPHRPVPGAVVWSYPNRPGSFKDAVQSQVKATLDAIVQGDVWFPMVFYCAGPDCWQGYNAALRAIHAGYKNVYWYRGGAEAWFAYQAALAQPQPDAQDSAGGDRPR